VNQDELLEQAAQELAAVLEQIEERGTCPLCVAGLLRRVAAGLVGDLVDPNTGPMLNH